MTCKVESPHGVYRCGFEVEKINLLMGEYNYAAKVSRVFLVKPSGEQVEIQNEILGEAYGATVAKAEAEMCREFREWVVKRTANG